MTNSFKSSKGQWAKTYIKIVVRSAGVVIIVLGIVTGVLGAWRAGLVVGDAIGAEH